MRAPLYVRSAGPRGQLTVLSYFRIFDPSPRGNAAFNIRFHAAMESKNILDQRYVLIWNHGGCESHKPSDSLPFHGACDQTHQMQSTLSFITASPTQGTAIAQTFAAHSQTPRPNVHAALDQIRKHMSGSSASTVCYFWWPSATGCLAVMLWKMGIMAGERTGHDGETGELSSD